MKGKSQTFSVSGNLHRCVAPFRNRSGYIDTIGIPAIIGPTGSGFVCACNRANEEVANLIAFVVRAEDLDPNLTSCSQFNNQ